MDNKPITSAATSTGVPAGTSTKPAPHPMKRPARTTPIGSTFADFATLPERQTPAGVFRSVFDAPAPTLERFEMHVTTLRAGATTHEPHFHPWEEILIVKEGSLDVSINGLVKEAGPGGVIFIASNDAHNVVNRSVEAATYYVINFYSEAVHGLPEGPMEAWATPDKLRSTVMNWEQGEAKDMTHDARRSFIAGTTCTFTNLKIHTTILAPNRYPVRHGAHLNALLVIVKEGVVESTLDTVTHQVGPGSVIFLAPGAIQTIRNARDVPAAYYVISVSTAETPR